jgi:glycerol-3-phosphate dehydrogenase
MKFRTEVLIIGGGATGVGIARDLSLRGIPSLLIEKGDCFSGASRRNHGLLHSGGRYVVSHLTDLKVIHPVQLLRDSLIGTKTGRKRNLMMNSHSDTIENH